MATPSKRWPNNAEWARMDSITLARKGRITLIELVDTISDPTILRSITKVIEIFREIETKLVEAKKE